MTWTYEPMDLPLRFPDLRQLPDVAGGLHRLRDPPGNRRLHALAPFCALIYRALSCCRIERFMSIRPQGASILMKSRKIPGKSLKFY